VAQADILDPGVDLVGGGEVGVLPKAQPRSHPGSHRAAGRLQ
jgi:hypothetical protein